ncbi:MAG: type I restriction enzyme HsdR N-terminal domain-containing protein [Tannerella sp.]|jgi:hypothetical protein|nr:type I restriction enzyme HsdR N-terminal domain-containing protein [Tannerella sp.]
MQPLNLPLYPPKVCRKNGKQYIFDPLRQKNVILTPEEWVRQHFVHYLTEEKQYPKELLANEVSITWEHLSRRCDTVVYNCYLEPLVIIEYKAPSVPVTQKVFEQIARYNFSLRVEYLMVSNGLEHYCCRIDYAKATCSYLKEIPAYDVLGKQISET